MADSATSSNPTPAYLPYATFLSALENLGTHGIPRTGKLDKTLWDNQSGAIQGQIVIAFRFMGLINEKNEVLPALEPLVKSKGEERKIMLRQLIEERYDSILKLDLLTISTGQLEEAFRKYDVSGSTMERAVRFFVRACQDVGIPISKRVSDKVRVSSGQKRARRTNSVRREAAEEVIVPEPQPQPRRAWEEKLLEKFPAFDPTWQDDIKAKWFESFERLMKA